jgi:hypothetical protein
VGVRYVSSGSNTFDEINGRFIFVGTDSNLKDSLYSIDVSIGNVITRVPFPVGLCQNDNLGSLVLKNNALYALLYRSSFQLQYLETLYPKTGVQSVNYSIPGFQSILSGSQVIDKRNHTYNFVGLGQIQLISKLYTVDLSNGATLRSAIVPNSTNQSHAIFHLKQNSANNLLEIFNAFNSNIYQLVPVNKAMGIHSFIYTLNRFSNYMPFNSIYNKSTNLYSFETIDSNSNFRFCNYNANTASLISNFIFPVLADTNDNVLNYKLIIQPELFTNYIGTMKL